MAVKKRPLMSLPPRRLVTWRGGFHAGTTHCKSGQCSAGPTKGASRRQWLQKTLSEVTDKPTFRRVKRDSQVRVKLSPSILTRGSLAFPSERGKALFSRTWRKPTAVPLKGLKVLTWHVWLRGTCSVAERLPRIFPNFWEAVHVRHHGDPSRTLPQC